MIALGPSPSERPFHGLWSLWEMQELLGGRFFGLLHLMFRTELQASATSGPLPPEMGGVNKTAAEAIAAHCDDIGLPITKRSTAYITSARTSEELANAFSHVKRNMHHELQERVFFAPDPRFIKYFKQSMFFGDEVFSSFPSASEDIYEAGTCLALERATACVMHAMRALEVGLSALSQALGIGEQTDWGAHLRRIAVTLDERTKAAGARSEDEQFYAEAAANFDRFRRAWRNPTMHPEKAYSQERAEEILLAVKSFMAHLATRVSE
jgi:hypothetical protein